MYETQTVHILLLNSLILQETKEHIFDGLHISSRISSVQICDNDCIFVLNKNEINILKYSKLILKGRQKTRWIMIHTHLKAIYT